MKDIRSIAEKAVRFGEALGASEVEAYATSTDSKIVIFTRGIETLYASYNSGLGVRIIVDKKTGFFATSSLAIKDVKRSVKLAYKIAKVSEPDMEWLSLPTKGRNVDAEQTFDMEIADIESSRLVESAVQMINTVSNCGEKLSITRGEVSTETVETAIVNSYDCNLCRRGTFASASISVKAEEAGMRGLSSENQQTRNWSELDCYSTAQIAAERASKVITAKPIIGGKMPVVWRNKLFASVLRIMFGGTLSADSVQKGRSPWVGRVGRPLASKNFTLIDDGLLRAGLGTREFDDDGIPQQKTILVDHGVLQGFLYDNYTANKDRRESTGNSARDYRSLPTPSPNNLILQKGNTKKEELIRDVKMGLYLYEVIGAWLSNPISGDLSATITNAFMIENGELTKPIKGIIISGNFFDILYHKIDLIADDVRNLGSTYSPSLRVSEMTVSGE